MALKGKKSASSIWTAPYGKELIWCSRRWPEVRLPAYPLSGARQGDAEPGSVWLQIRRDRPDWLYNQGWGAMNPTAVREAAKNNFPLDRFVGVCGPAATATPVSR
ncbi:MAG: hypothetical protein R3E48_23280 [Burkholderiaceae bacterium]